MVDIMTGIVSSLLFILLFTLRSSTAVFTAGLGNMYCERVGILNLGAEGMMTSGAFCAVLGSFYTGNPWIGVLCGIIGGGITGLVHALVCVEFGGIHEVAGLGLNLFAGGFINFLCVTIFKSDITPSVNSLTSMPQFASIPVIGSLLTDLSPILFIIVAIAILSYQIVYKTPLGIRFQALGDDPKTVEAAGIDVWRMKYLGVVVCGCICGLAGAYMSVGYVGRFAKGMISGKGMLAVIAVKMGNWNPIGIMSTALLLGLFDAIQLQIQLNSTINIPPELVQTIPFWVGILVLALQRTTKKRPVSLGKPYLRNKYKFQ